MSTLADIPVPYNILFRPAPTMSGDESGWEATMGLSVAYGSDTIKLLKVVSGLPQTVNGVTRVVPLQHPDISNMLANRVQVRGMGGQQNNGTVWGTGWSLNEVVITFRTVPWPIFGQNAFLQIDTQIGGEYITLPNNSFYFPSDNTPLPVDAGVFVPTMIYTITSYFCPNLNDDMAASLYGSVNSATIFNRPAGTVRFDGQRSVVTVNSGFTATYTKTLLFTFRAVPHNQVLRPNGAWEAPVSQTGGSTIYQSQDLTPLLVN